MSDGYVKTDIAEGVATVEFFHPKKNSLPGSLLAQLAQSFDALAENDEAKVIVLQSGGASPFCAGASFDELLAIEDIHQGKEFFMGFARVILAMKRCPKFVIVRVQGKAVGGGVGVISSADHALATDRCAVKLSELALGIGPFVVGPAVERKIGSGPFSAMSIDTDWRDAAWAADHGLYASVHPDVEALDVAVNELATKLAASSPEAMARLKEATWQGTDHWDELLEKRAEESGRLILGEYARGYIAQFRK